ncbi:MAG: hypothetical protein GYA41_01745 [Bacteroidales bacterium]|nr:hypothetical protein [Bacteroidales bacterium]
MKKSLVSGLLVISSFIFTLCSKDPGPVVRGVTDNYLSGAGVFILNEGNFRTGNGSLSFFSYDSSKIFNNVFLQVNSRLLGDIPYSMAVSNGKAYIVVNNSGKIEVVDGNTMESLTTINKLSSPRYISFATATKAYVTSLYSDSITILDTEKDKISGYIDIRHTSETIIAIENKAFAASWAGGNKIFVIDILSDAVTDSIEVGREPESMAVDKNGTLWVLCNGGWQRDSFAELTAIDTRTDEILRKLIFPLITDSPTSLQIDGKGENLFFLLNGGVMQMNIDDAQLPEIPLISPPGTNLYKLGINPGNSEIFITDAKDYQSKGDVFRYDKKGVLISKMEADIIPGSVCFRTGTLLPGK